MTNSSLRNNLYWQLLRVAINIKHGMMVVAEKHHLTVMQMYTLCLMEKDASIPMNSLSDMLHCDASNVTGIIDKLFQLKFVKREECQKDRRVKLLTLTPKGAALCEKISNDLLIYQPESLRKLTDEQKQQLLSLLISSSLTE